jgi:hypothetical protein
LARVYFNFGAEAIMPSPPSIAATKFLRTASFLLSFTLLSEAPLPY